MNMIKYKNRIRLISLVLSMCIFWQASGWADSGVFVRNTLQGRTLFTSPYRRDSVSSFITSYFGLYLKDMENDRENLNITRLEWQIKFELGRLQSLAGVPAAIKKVMPEVVIDNEKTAVTINLHSCKIRYFNHNIPGAEIPSRKASERYKIIQTQIGRYLTKQILIRKTFKAQDDKENGKKQYVKKIKDAIDCYDHAYKFISFGKKKKALKKLDEGVKHLAGISGKYIKAKKLRERIETTRETIEITKSLNFRRDDIQHALRMAKNKKRSRAHKLGKDARHPGPRFGPALFVDPDTGVLRELSDECDESGGMTEHEAVNEACKELIFDRGQDPLKTGDPVYDFLQEDFTMGEITTYVVNDEELKEKLAQKGYPRLAEGLITHAGTFGGKAYNIFIPESVYQLLLELLERKFEQKMADDLLEFWKNHEQSHLLDREYLDRDKSDASIRNSIADVILTLAKALRALEKKEFERVITYVDKVIEKDDTFAFSFELKGRIHEAQKNWDLAWRDYLMALVEINKQRKKITHGHSLENKILDMVASNPRNEIMFFKKLEKVAAYSPLDYSKLSDNVIVGLCMLAVEEERESSKNNFLLNKECMHNDSLRVLFLGMVPIMCAYLDRALKNRPKITSFETEIVIKLLDVVSKNEILSSKSENRLYINDLTLARIYCLAGEVFKARGDFPKALEYFEKSISYDNNVPFLYAKMAFSLVKNEQTLESVEKAIKILTNAEKKLGKENLFSNDKLLILEEKGKIVADQKKEEKLKETYYSAIILFENGKYKECMDLLSGIESQAHGMKFYEDLTELKEKVLLIVKLKQRARTCFKQKSYEEAGELFTRILEKSPNDVEIIGLAVDLLIILQNKKREEKKQKHVCEYIKSIEELCRNADNQVSSGRMERARSNYTKVLAILEEASYDEKIQKKIDEINGKFEKIKDLPDTIKRQRETKSEKSVKKKKEKNISPVPSNKEMENSSRKVKIPVFRYHELNLRLAPQAVRLLRKIDEDKRNEILNGIKQTAVGNKKKVKKLEIGGNLYLIRINDYRALYTICDGGVMLICEIKKGTEIIYHKEKKSLAKQTMQDKLLHNSISLEEFVESFLPEKRKSKKEKKTATNPTQSDFRNLEIDFHSTEGIKKCYSRFDKSDTVFDDDTKQNLSISLLAHSDADDLRKNIRESILKEIGRVAEILSVGVGTGIFDGGFVTAGCGVTGLDITSEPLRLAEKRGINTVNTDANKPDFWDEIKNNLKYDAVFVCESIGHFEYEIFKRIRKVLKPGGKIYILTSPGSEKKQKGYREFNRDDVTRELGLCGFGEINEKKFLHWAGAVRLISGTLTVENDEKTKASESLKSLCPAENIEANTKDVAPCLVQGLIDVAEGVAEKKEKAILYFDEVLAESGEKSVARARERLLRALMHIEDNNEELSLFLKDKLEIRSGSKEEFVAKIGRVKPENIIVVTNKTNFESGCFSRVNGKGVIAAIDDTAFSKKAYLPLLGPVLLAVGKYLNWDEKMLSEYYEKIPNVILIEDLSNEEYAKLFGKDSKTIIINLIPDAAKFNTQQHVRIIERVRDILSKA